VADLTNDFSWSRSRDGVFQDCKRRYFYQYYGSWGGWASDAPEDVRRLYILIQLATRQMWAGRIVHDAIEMALNAYREGIDIPVEPFVRDAVERMRGEWKSSKAGRYRELPKTTALFEHEYHVDLRDEVWKMLAGSVQTCLRNFFRLPLLAEVRMSKDDLVRPDGQRQIADRRLTDFLAVDPHIGPGDGVQRDRPLGKFNLDG